MFLITVFPHMILLTNILFQYNILNTLFLWKELRNPIWFGMVKNILQSDTRIYKINIAGVNIIFSLAPIVFLNIRV